VPWKAAVGSAMLPAAALPGLRRRKRSGMGLDQVATAVLSVSVGRGKLTVVVSFVHSHMRKNRVCGLLRVLLLVW